MAYPDPIDWTKQVGMARTFVASTAVAGVAPGTALSTTPPMVIYNPTGATVRVAILQVSVGYVSGTLGAGTIAYASHSQAAAPTGGTQLTPVNCFLGQANNAKATAWQGSTLDGTPTIVRPAFGLQASLATTAVAPWVLKDFVAGEFMISPGYCFAVQGVTATGSTPLVLISVTWAELPV